VVLLDTSIIIEAFRAGAWNALTSHFNVETVERCYEEALAGDPLRAKNYVKVDANQLRKGLRRRHDVTDMERAALLLREPTADSIDDGERDLFAHALGRTDHWLASAADRAAINVGLALDWEESIASLERLVGAAGARHALQYQFTEAWLSEVRTTYKLGRDLS
jgi:hypothetical protein